MIGGSIINGPVEDEELHDEAPEEEMQPTGTSSCRCSLLDAAGKKTDAAAMLQAALDVDRLCRDCRITEGITLDHVNRSLQERNALL